MFIFTQFGKNFEKKNSATAGYIADRGSDAGTGCGWGFVWVRLRFSRGAYSVGGVVLGLDWPGDTLSIFICQFSVLPKKG